MPHTMVWPECVFDMVNWGDGQRDEIDSATVDERGCRQLGHTYRGAGPYEVTFLSGSPTNRKIVHYEQIDIPEDGCELIVLGEARALPKCALTEDCPSDQHYANCPQFHLIVPLVATTNQDERAALMSVISQAMNDSGAFALGGPIPPGVYRQMADAIIAAGWLRPDSQ